MSNLKHGIDCSDTAPQPPPVVQLSQQQVIDALERGQLALLDRIVALEAKLAEEQKAIRIISEERDGAQERLAMVVEALRDAQKWATRWAQTTEHRDPNANDYGPYNQHPRGYAICPIPDWEVKQKRDDYAYALAATAESVAQHTASVERRGAIKELERIAAGTISSETRHILYTRIQALNEGSL